MTEVPIQNVKAPSGGMSEAVANQLADVISELVTKAVNEALDQRLSDGKIINTSSKPSNLAGAGRFLPPKGD